LTATVGKPAVAPEAESLCIGLRVVYDRFASLRRILEHQYAGMFTLLQGLGGAMLISSGYAIIPKFLLSNMTGWAFGILAQVATHGSPTGSNSGRSYERRAGKTVMPRRDFQLQLTGAFSKIISALVGTVASS